MKIMDIAKKYKEELQDGIAYLLLGKSGRIWFANIIYADYDPKTGLYELDEQYIYEDICTAIKTDKNAILLNGYNDVLDDEDFTVRDIADKLKYLYEGHCNVITPNDFFVGKEHNKTADTQNGNVSAESTAIQTFENTAIQTFENTEFGKVRTVVVDDEPYFVGKDVATILGYRETAKAIREKVDADDKGVSILDTPGGKQKAIIINESGLYSLILSSKLPNAKKFKRWVTSEVLPSIRQNGAYMTPEILEKALLNPDTLIKLCQNLKSEQDKNKVLTADIERMKPKEIFADAVATSDKTILVGDLAKILKQNGVDIGANRLFAWLREQGYLIKCKGSDWNMPTRKSMEMKLFEVKETSITHSDGHISISKTTKVTGKGQVYFINKFKTIA